MERVSIKGRMHSVYYCPECGVKLFIPNSRLGNDTYRCNSCAVIKRNKENAGRSIYSYDRNYFRSGNLQAHYWAGFIAADGYIGTRGYHLSIKLSDKDISLLERFKRDTKFSGDILKSGTETRKRLIIGGCKEWIEDLDTLYNIGNAKSFTLLPPNITSQRDKLAYIVGLIDGDGHISVGSTGYFKFGIIGTPRLLKWVKATLDEISPTETSNISVAPRCKALSNYAVYGKRAIKLARHLKDMPIEKLDRKWNLVP